MVVSNPLNNLTPEKEEELKKVVSNVTTEKKWTFNSLNGEIKSYDTKEDFDTDMSKGGFVPIDRLPAKNCSSCYGRGHIGKNIRWDRFAACGCMFRKPRKGV